MSIKVPQFDAQDDVPLVSPVKDISGGMNNRFYGADIPPNQITLLKNADIGVPGESAKRPGEKLLKDVSNSPCTGAFGFEPDGGTNELLITEGTNLRGCTNPAETGSDTFTTHKADFTSGLLTTMFKGAESGEGDVVFISNGIDNWFRMNQSHTMQDLGSTSGTGSDSPPKSTVGTFFRNRFWVFKVNLGYFSDAFPSDYSNTFDTVTQMFRMQTGTERAIVGLREQGLVFIGADQIWGLNPSAVPDPSTDKPEKLLSIGCTAGNTAQQVNDDIWFTAEDGLRGVFRSSQDKLNMGVSYPLSYLLHDEWASINKAYITKACGVFWDGKYFISVPVDGSTYNNEVWVFWPSNMVQVSNAIIVPAAAVITGWNVAAWAKLRVNGEERLYAVDSADGKSYRVWTGTDDNGTDIDYHEEGRADDMGEKLKKKSGGELEIKAKSSGNYDVPVYVAADDNDFTYLGVINLTGLAPTLPVSLPFTLANPSVVRKKFHLESLGEWNTLKYKIQHNSSNPNDEIVIYERNLISYPSEYYNE